MVEKMFKDVGERVALVRKKHHMKQIELAEKLDVSPKHISHVERGVSAFSLKNLVQFCNLFGCDINYILMGRESEDLLSKIPREVTDILNTGSDEDIHLLNEYLNMYIKILNAH